MSMACIQPGTWWRRQLLVSAAMTQRAPAGRVSGQGVYPSVMTTMAAGRVSAAVWMPLAMSVPRPPAGVIWRAWVMCWLVLISSSTERTRMAWPGIALVKMALISLKALACSWWPMEPEVSSTTVTDAVGAAMAGRITASDRSAARNLRPTTQWERW